MSDYPTIYAPATATGRGAIAIIRVSGSNARDALRTLTGKAPPRPRLATLRRLRHPDGTTIDDALVLWFPAPRSYTGEDMVEFHIHGGQAVQTALLDALGACAGLLPAPAGGFTRQAVLNGRLDFTQAEGIADVIDADSPAQLWQALQQKQGALATIYNGWRQRLLHALAYVEAELEFAEEGLPDDVSEESAKEVREIAEAMEKHLRADHSERVRSGLEIALIGAPNVGKSSLLNRLAGRKAAIVSARAGTTRDVIEVAFVLKGLPVLLVDMAGIRAAKDNIEREGVRSAQRRAETADLRLFVRAPRCAITPAEKKLEREGDIFVSNKADLKSTPLPEHIAISAKTGKGMAKLLSALGNRLRSRYASAAPSFTRARHRKALQSAYKALQRAGTAHQAGKVELAAEDIRLAARELGRITGEVDVERLLDIVFADFCIGK